MPSAGDVRAGGAYVEITGNEAGLIKSLDSAEARLNKFGSKMTQMGKTMLMAGTAMLAPLAVGVKKLASFQDQMAKVSTMLSGSDMELLPGMAEGVRKLSKEMGEGTQTITDGLYSILSSSIPAAKAMDVLTVSMKAARGGYTDTGIAADAITTILNSYGLEAQKAADVSDFLFTVVKKGKMDFATLAPAIGMVASTAANMGVSLEEVGASLATMTRAGVRTNVAVTSLNAIIETFRSGSDDAKEAASKLGIELSSEWLATNGLAAALEKLSGATQEEVAAVFENRRALRGLAPMLGNVEGYMGDLAAMTDRGGNAQEAYEKSTTSLGFRLDQLAQKVTDLFVTIGQALEGPATDFLAWLAKALEGVSEWIKKNPGWVQAFAALAVAITGIGTALLALGVAAKAAGIALAGMKVAAHAASFMGLKAGVVGSTAKLGLFSKAALAVGVAIAGWQIGKKLAELTGLDKAIQGLAYKWDLFGGRSADEDGRRMDAKTQRILASNREGKKRRQAELGVSNDEWNQLTSKQGGYEKMEKAFRESGKAGVKALVKELKGKGPGGKPDPATIKATAEAAASAVGTVMKTASDVKAWLGKGLATLGASARNRTGSTTQTREGRGALDVRLIGHRVPSKLGLGDFESSTRGSFSGRALGQMRGTEGLAIRAVDLLKLIADASKATAKNTGKNSGSSLLV